MESMLLNLDNLVEDLVQQVEKGQEELRETQ